MAKLPGARFLIAGRDTGIPLIGKTYQDYFREIADEPSLAATSFLGYVDDETLERLYRECDIFVAPSLFESFGLVHLEAMARRRPVVACRSAATPELVEDGVTGMLVPPADSVALAEALVTLGRDPDARMRMGEAGRRRVEQCFSVSAMVDSSIRIYQEAIELWAGRRN